MKILFSLLLSLMAFNVSANEIRNINDFQLASYQGKVIYLDFWASWCIPCRKSFPWMNGLTNKFPAEQFEVVTINLDSKEEDMMKFLEHVPAQFTIYHDPAGSMAEQFKLPAMPTSFLIDKTGQLFSRHIGFYTKKIPALEAEIENLL